MKSAVRKKRRGSSNLPAGRRRGAATLDYALILGVVMPMMAFTMWLAPEMIRKVYEMSCTLVSWPFM